MKSVKGLIDVVPAIIIGILSCFLGPSDIAADDKVRHNKPNNSTSRHEVELRSSSTITKAKISAEIPDLSVDYPKRPLNVGEKMPFNRPPQE